MKCVLIDNLSPNQPALVNLERVDCVSWKSGTLTFEFGDSRCVEVECEKDTFIQLASKIDIAYEIE